MTVKLRKYAFVALTITLTPLASMSFPNKGVAQSFSEIGLAQYQLDRLGYDPGPVDGLWGRKTDGALRLFLNDQGIEFDGRLSQNELLVLSRVMEASNLNPDPPYVIGANTFGDRLQIPSGLDYQVNDPTLEHFFRINQRSIENKRERLRVSPSETPSTFNFELRNSARARTELATSAIFSYLYFEEDRIVYDMLPPEGRFTVDVNDRSYFPSHSMGKSLVSYLIGHAICQGYIGDVDEPISDWKLMESTLYYGQPLINLLNMTAGDTSVIAPLSGSFKGSGRNIHGVAPLYAAANNPKELQNTTSDGIHEFSYSNLTTDVLMSYLMHRVGQGFEVFINEFFQEKVRIEHPVYMWMNPVRGNSSELIAERILQGAGQYAIDATRYDYLRLARAIMDDWQQETCVGNYLREIYDRRVLVPRASDNPVDKWDGSMRRWGDAQFGTLTYAYAGQFWAELHEFRDRNILVLNGADGQNIAIDMDNSRIVVVNSGQEGWGNLYALAYDPLRFGYIRD